MKLLNVGCGNRFHPAWTNVDLTSRHEDVEEYDLRRGLPYSDGSFDGVYHSHVLEHLPPAEGQKLLKDCYRILKPGGVLRVVVPNLEAIVRGYLEQLEGACAGKAGAAGRYDWMTFELLDQMVRSQSGGMMGPAMHDSKLEAHTFICERLGDELQNSDANGQQTKQKKNRLSPQYLKRKLSKLRIGIGTKLVSILLPELNSKAIAEMRFRQTGEVHRWMYDRFSLCRAFRDAGFADVRCETASSSRIENFDSFELDAVGERIRKPDSLFVEGIKPAMALRKVA